jgi:hypothetical protein
MKDDDADSLDQIVSRCLNKCDELQSYLGEYKDYLEQLVDEKQSLEASIATLNSRKRGPLIRRCNDIKSQIQAYTQLIETYSKESAKTDLQLDLVPLIKACQDNSKHDEVKKQLKAVCDRIVYPVPRFPVTMQTFGLPPTSAAAIKNKKQHKEAQNKSSLTATKDGARPPKRVSGEATYLRINHFKEFLRQVQGKSRVYIRKHVFNALRAEFKKRRQNVETVTPQIVRLALRAAKLQKYYEHVPAITRKMSKTYMPINIPIERERQLARMFLQTETPFTKHKRKVKKGRQNFFSYPYVCYKMCELLGWDGEYLSFSFAIRIVIDVCFSAEYLSAFQLLKSGELLVLQDKWWKLVCDELGWEFIPTVGNIAHGNLLNLVDGLS